MLSFIEKKDTKIDY